MKSYAVDSIRLCSLLFILLAGDVVTRAQSKHCELPGVKVTCEDGQDAFCKPEGDTVVAECRTRLSGKTADQQGAALQKINPSYSATARYLASSPNLKHMANCIRDPYLATDEADLRKEEIKWRKKLQENPNEVGHHYWLAYTLLSLARTPLDNDKLVEAEKEFRIVLQQEPPSVQSFDRFSGSALRRLGVTLFEQGRYPEAEDVFQRFIKVSDDYFSSGRATELNNPCSLIMLALTQAARQNYKDAEANIIRSESMNTYSYILLGSVLFDQGKFPNAEAAYRTALRFPAGTSLAARYYEAPLRLAAQEGLVAALLNQGKYVDAETAAEQLGRGMNEAWFIFKTGLSLLKQGKYTDAEKSFNEAIAFDPQNVIFREALKISRVKRHP